MNYYFTNDAIPTKAEIAENKKLEFTFLNGRYGDDFHRNCDKVAGKVPEHLKDKEVKVKKTPVKVKSNKEAATKKSTVEALEVKEAVIETVEDK